ncbi:HD-GYP domain-containing protein [uncultured Tolumonas sp.]|uniref:HD-GYP domain-containing protein n=1 Tax=uncultured Tolumonas sp. TaxID=263765 RepID=UPI00292CBFF2|nr:HD-GYP domain-containing protein [uncultured Tolumonas sp.]
MSVLPLSTENYQNVAIRDIKLGMFVIAVTKQKGDIHFKPGMVSSEATCRSLQSMGVLEVKIDLTRSKHQQETLLENPESNLAPEEQVQEIMTPTEKKESRKQAQKLYAEAKILQTKLLDALKNGEVVDIAPLEAMADEMVDSIFKNPDAMIFLSRIREKDTYLMEHSLNVGMLLANFGRYLKLSRQTIKDLLVGGLLHDTGKVMVPDEILHKPGRLTPDEFVIMKKHVEYSVQFLDKAEGISSIMRTVAANHHERLDGLGYPRGLKGLELCLISRISTIVDVFDALTADRCYKKGMQATQAFHILLQGAGTQFDETLVKQFIKCMGIYPIGSLVKLKTGKLALVIESNTETPLQPVVKIIYSTTGQHYLDVKIVDLARNTTEEIENVVHPKAYGIDISQFF